MTTETKKLHEKRAGLVTEMIAIRDKAVAENREMSKEENEKFDRLDNEAEALHSTIRRVEKVNELTKDERAAIEQTAQRNGQSANEIEDTRKAEARAFSNMLRVGESKVSSEDRKILEGMKARAQSVGTTTAGGFLVPEGFQAELITAMKAFGGVRDVARVLTTTTGNDIPWPNMDDTSNTGALLAENTGVSEQDLVFGSTTLKAYKYSSKAVKVSNELLQDSGINVDGILAEALATRIARITNTHFTTGDNSSKPQGIVNSSGAGKTSASETAITYAEIVDLEHSVDPAYRGNGRFMMHDSILKAIKKLDIGSSDARPLWEPGLLRLGTPSTILGYPYLINQDMASSLAADNKVMLFGDFSYYVVRDVLPFTLKRLVERYADADQVGFFAFSRNDGRKVSSDNPYKHLVMINT